AQRGLCDIRSMQAHERIDQGCSCPRTYQSVRMRLDVGGRAEDEPLEILHNDEGHTDHVGVLALGVDPRHRYTTVERIEEVSLSEHVMGAPGDVAGGRTTQNVPRLRTLQEIREVRTAAGEEVDREGALETRLLFQPTGDPVRIYPNRGP